MFKGEKTALFWVGLGILGFASTFFLFNSLWSVVYQALWGQNALFILKLEVPRFVEGVAFILIGLYMMKTGVKKP